MRTSSEKREKYVREEGREGGKNGTGLGGKGGRKGGRDGGKVKKNARNMKLCKFDL